MKLNNALILRPKHALWLLVAVLGSAWYIADPQARPLQSQVRGTPAASAALIGIQAVGISSRQALTSHPS